MKRVRAIPVVAVSLAAALALTACSHSGSGDTTAHGSDHRTPTSTASSTGSTGHNAADVAFAQMMIPHHRQALEMGKLAATRTADPQVKALAARIESEQQPEIRTMTAWLTAWETPASHLGHGAMPGMMSDADMTKLRAATGTAFDRMFLQMMIRHHAGAVQMAKTELAEGQNPEAKTLAQTIAAAQTAEIVEMRRLLGAMK